MIILQIEHPVPSFEGWKKAFESDPINRKKSGVIEYRIYKALNNANLIIVDLVFESIENAQSALQALQKVWGQVEGVVMSGPKTRFLEIIDSKKI